MSIETLRVHTSLSTNYTNPNNDNQEGDAIFGKLGTCNMRIPLESWVSSCGTQV